MKTRRIFNNQKSVFRERDKNIYILVKLISSLLHSKSKIKVSIYNEKKNKDMYNKKITIYAIKWLGKFQFFYYLINYS